MKHQRLASVVVGLLSIGAGVAIAGVPDNVPADAAIMAPTTTDATEPTVATTTTVRTTTVPETTTPDITDPETTETTETTDPTDPTDPTDTTDTTDPAATDSVPAELAERGQIVVAAANGANVTGAALRVAGALETLGYVDVLSLNGTDIEEFTVVYFADGFEAAALRLADDLALLPDFVATIEIAPGVADLPSDVELLVYIGRDRA